VGRKSATRDQVGHAHAGRDAGEVARAAVSDKAITERLFARQHAAGKLQPHHQPLRTEVVVPSLRRHRRARFHGRFHAHARRADVVADVKRIATFVADLRRQVALFH